MRRGRRRARSAQPHRRQQGGARTTRTRYPHQNPRARARTACPAAVAPTEFVAILKDKTGIPIYAEREARPRRHPRSPDSIAVQLPEGRAKAGRAGQHPGITHDARRPSRAAQPGPRERASRLSSASSRPSAGIRIVFHGVAGARHRASGTEPAALRTLTLPAVARQGDDEPFFPPASLDQPKPMGRLPRSTRPRARQPPATGTRPAWRRARPARPPRRQPRTGRRRGVRPAPQRRRPDHGPRTPLGSTPARQPASRRPPGCTPVRPSSPTRLGSSKPTVAAP
jgi:hypothetical protein